MMIIIIIILIIAGSAPVTPHFEAAAHEHQAGAGQTGWSNHTSMGPGEMAREAGRLLGWVREQEARQLPEAGHQEV